MSDVRVMPAQSSGARGLCRLSIDLAAICDNWRYLKGRLKPGCTCSAVVKADAYGLGAVPVAVALFRAGCRLFFVATLDEAVILRRALPIEAEIAVLHGLVRGEEALYAAQRLIPVLNRMDELDCWRVASARAGAPLPAIVHIDTGMKRLGFSGAELEQLQREGCEGIDVLYVMSHLACSDEKDHPKNAEQLENFRTALSFFPSVRASLASSSGIFLGEAMHFDLVRPGVALYGINPQPGAPNPLKTVVTLEAEVLQVVKALPGETTGYGAGHVFNAPTRLATLGIGYADGYFRNFSNGRGHVAIGGVMAPVVGRVSMDLVTVDISALPDGAVVAGHKAEVIGPHRRVDDLAQEAGTIGYEVLTALGRRHIRDYIG